MKCLKYVFALAMMTIAFPYLLTAQGVDAAMLVHPPTDSWPGYNGDYSGRRHSPLKQITPQNVKDLGLAWAFQTNQIATIKSSPLLVDGILYFTVLDDIWAVDARSGHQIWHYNILRTKGSTLANGAWPCTKKIYSICRPMRIWYLSTPRMARYAGK
jgi:alcohol dehydrogenase (cytochrome c)